MPAPSGIMALDIASVTGWAFGQPGALPIWGSERVAHRGQEDGEVYDEFAVWLDGQLDRHRPAIVVIESPYLPRAAKPRIIGHDNGKPLFATTPAINMDTIRRLVVLGGLAERAAAHRRLICRQVEPQTIAKTFIGYGGLRRAEKKAAVVRMCKLYGWEVDDDNAADALAIFATAEAVLFPMVHRRASGALFAR